MVKSGENFEELVSLYSLSTTKCSIKNNYEFFSPRIGRGTETDVIVITEHRIYCVECKNFNGYLTGSELDLQWVFASSGRKSKVANPVLANYKHIRSIKGLLRKMSFPAYEIENIVCVPNKTKIHTNCSEVMTLGSFLFKLEIDKYLDKIYDINEVSEIFDAIKV